MPKRTSKPKMPLNRSQIAAFKMLYDAAGYGRRMRGWMPSSSGPNKAVVGIQNIRNRSRDSSRNDWSGESAIQKWATNLIGVGIAPRFKRIKDASRKEVVTDLWNDFVSVSDADGVLNYYGQQTLAVRAWLESGEVFVRKRFRRKNSVLPVPLQVQLIEADYVPMLDADNWPGLPRNNRIRSGIELDSSNQRIAYWVYKEHPGDGERTIGKSDLLRVPASEIRHMFEPKRPGQLRGVPVMASVLARLRNIADYDDAVLERQKLANLFVAFITRSMPGMDADMDIDPLTNLPIEVLNGEPLAGMQPGITQELDPGQDVKFANPPEAGTTYSDYMRTSNMGTAAAAGLPYEVFSGDIREISDRTLRVIIQEFRRFAEQRQWQIIIPMFCQPVVEWFAEAALLAGKVSADEYEMARRPEHSPHGWAYIHPVQDPQGKQLEVVSGFRSRSSVIAESGEDAEAVDAERAADKEREDRLGLTPEPVAPAGAKAGQDESTKADPKKDEPTQLDTAVTALLASQATMLAADPPAPTSPTINVHVGMPSPAPVNNVVNVEPAPVNNVVNVEPTPINNQVTVEGSTVNMPEPVINVTNNVPASEVTVHLPARKTEATVEYDDAGNIVKTTQVETDAE